MHSLVHIGGLTIFSSFVHIPQVLASRQGGGTPHPNALPLPSTQ